MKRFRSIPLAFLLFLSLLPLSAPAGWIPLDDLKAIAEMTDEVDVARWFGTIEDLAENGGLRSRFCLRVEEHREAEGQPVPDDACDRAARYILERFKSYGLEAELIPFKHRVETIGGELLGEYTLHNVVAVLPGKGPNRGKEVLVTAHYDSIASKAEGWEERWNEIPAPGADDNGSGTALLLEAARVLSRYEFDYTIKFIAFSGEELGLFGSRNYAKRAREAGEEIVAVINVDMVGHDEDGVLDLHVVSDELSEWIGNAFKLVKEELGIGGELVVKVDPKFVWSDHSPFWREGYNAVMVSEESSMESPEWPKFIHSPDDTPDKIDLGMGEIALRLVVATVALIADPMPPDRVQLALTDLYAPEEVGRVEAEVPVELRVANLSDLPAEGVTLHLEVLTPSGEEIDVMNEELSLGPGEEREVRAVLIGKEWGRYRLVARLNPNFGAVESDFTDNHAEAELLIRSFPPRPRLVRAYPNPFDGTGSLRLSYQLSEDADVIVRIFDLSGRLIRERDFPAGTRGGMLGPNDVVIWDGRSASGERVASGVYILQLIAGSSSMTGKICVLK